MLFGTVVKATETTPYVPRPLEDGAPKEIMHLSGVAIPADCNLKLGTRISLMLKKDDETLCIATLAVGYRDSTLIDISLDGYAEFSILGPKAAVLHLHGQYVPDGEASDDEEMVPGQQLFRKQLQSLVGQPSGLGEDADEDGEDDEAEDNDEDSSEDDQIATRNKGTKHVETNKMEYEDDSDDSDEDESDDDDEDGDEDQQIGSADKKPKGKVEEVQAPADDDNQEEDDDDEEEDDDDDDDEDEQEEEDDDDDENTEQQTRLVKHKASAHTEAPPAKRSKRTVFANGFEVIQIKESSDPSAKQAKPSKTVAVKYIGTLQKSGKVFDATKGNKTFSFRLGVGEVIKGWDKGVAGMRVGDKRKLVIPPEMAYGETGVRNVIPRNATLCFDIELCGVK